MNRIATLRLPAERDKTRPALLPKKLLRVEATEPVNILRDIACILAEAPRPIFRVETLERIVAAESVDALETDLVNDLACRWEWLDGFLPRLNMWISVSEAVLAIRDTGHRWKPDSAFAEQRSRLNELLTDALAAYPSAVLEGRYYVEGYPVAATHELLKRYWAYTRYVCEFVHESWPGIMKQLDAQA